MINLKKLLNGKLFALTAIAGITPFVAQSALAESTSLSSEKGVLMTQTSIESPNNPNINERGNINAPATPGDLQVPPNSPNSPNNPTINERGNINAPATPRDLQVPPNSPNSPNNPTINERGNINAPATPGDLQVPPNSPTINDGGVQSPTLNQNNPPLNDRRDINSPGRTPGEVQSPVNNQNNPGVTSPGAGVQNDPANNNSEFIGVPAR